MPRANRYILPDCLYHLTHRCHDREFLFRFAVTRSEYRRRLRVAVKEFRVSLLNYCVTSNHTHLLAEAPSTRAVSRMMQKLEGEFAERYNLRKKRNGAFWTESVPLGSESFVDHVRSKTRRARLETKETRDGLWTMRETPVAYNLFSGVENAL